MNYTLNRSLNIICKRKQIKHPISGSHSDAAHISVP